MDLDTDDEDSYYDNLFDPIYNIRQNYIKELEDLKY